MKLNQFWFTSWSCCTPSPGQVYLLHFSLLVSNLLGKNDGHPLAINLEICCQNVISSHTGNSLHTCVYIYIGQLNSFRAPMLWFITLLTVTTCHYSKHFSEFMPICLMRKRRKHENTLRPPFLYHTNMAADLNTGAQSINTERAS